MTQSAVLRIQSTCSRTSARTDALQTRDWHQSQSPEDSYLADHVARAVRATGYGSLRGIAVSVRTRCAILVGRVPTYYLKQIAQATALSVPGVDRVVNDLEVGRST